MSTNAYIRSAWRERGIETRTHLLDEGHDLDEDGGVVAPSAGDNRALYNLGEGCRWRRGLRPRWYE